MGARDYSPTAASNLSVGGVSIAEGWAPAAVNNAARATMADTANLLLDLGGEIETTGSAGSYAVALPSSPGGYANNLLFVCKLNHSAPGASTMNVSGLGAKDFKYMVNGVLTPLTAAAAPAGHRVICLYSSSANAVLLLNSATALGPFPETVAASTYTPVAADANAKLKLMTSASNVLVTLPPGVFSVPTVLAFEQGSTGAVKIVGGGGVTVAAPDGLLPISAGQGHILYAVLLAPNSFVVVGGLVAPQLDATLQLAVISRNLTAPPGSPVEGARYIPKATATGAWAGQENKIAHFIDGAWAFYTPSKGWLSGIDDEDIAVRYNGAAWVAIYQPEVGTWTPTLIGETSGSATLVTADGGYVRSGRHVHTHCHIVTQTTITSASLSGQLSIGNIPFTASTLPGVAGRTGGIIPFWVGLTLPAGTLGMWSWLQDDNRFRLYRSILTGGNQSVTNAHIAGAGTAITLYCTQSYVTA